MAIKLDLLEVENIYNKDGEQTLNLTGDQGIVVSGKANISGRLEVGSYTVASQGNQSVFGNINSFQSSGSTNLYLGVKNGSYPNRGWSFDPVLTGVNCNLIIKEHGSTAERIKISTGGNFEVLTGSVDVAKTLSVGSGSSRFIFHSGNSLVTGSGTSNATEIDWKDSTHYIPSLAYAFRVKLVVTGTGTDTGASYIVYYNNTTSAWVVRYINRAGTTSNHAQLTIVTDGTGTYMAAYHTHSGGYNIRYWVETFDSGDQDMDAHAFGSDFQWQRSNDTLTYTDGDVTVGSNSLTAGSLDINGVADINSGSTNIPLELFSSDAGCYVRYDDGADANRWYTGVNSGVYHVYNNSNVSVFSLNASNNATFAGTISSGAITSTGNIQTSGDMVIGAELMHSGDTDTKLRFDTDQVALYTAGASRLVISNTQSFFSGNVKAQRFSNSFNGVPTNNLGTPSVSEMALFEGQMKPQTTLANNYDNLDDLKIFTRASGSGESDFAEVTSYSDDQKRRFMRTFNSSFVIPYGHNAFRLEFVAPSYVYANLMYAYWSSNGHTTQVHVWKRRCDNNTWYQHTSSTATISSWPGHMYLPFSTIPWHETNTTSSSHYNKIRIEFLPNWNSSYSSNNINLSGLQIWGGYPSGKRTVHNYDQNGKLDLFKDLGLPDGGIATFGNGDDLKIYHDGSNSYIEDGGSGNLKIRTNSLNVMNQANSENMISASQDAAVTLYYNGSEKFKTTNTGVDVTGSINTSTGTNIFTHIQNAGSRIELKNNRQDAGNVEIYRVGAYNSSTEVSGVHFYRGGGGNSGYTKIFAKKNNSSSLEEVVQFGTNDALTTTFAGNVTLPGIVLDGNTITGIDDSDEFTDDDAHIMTSAAVNDRITSRISGLGGGTGNGDMLLGTAQDITANKEYQDTVTAKWGTDGDFGISHNGNNTIIKQFASKTGNIYLVQATEDQDIIFQADDGASGTTSYMTIDGGDEIVRVHKPLWISDYITHIGDTNTFFGFSAADTFVVHAGASGHAELTITGTTATFAGDVTVEGILNMHDSSADLAIQGDSNGNAYYINSAGKHMFRANGSGFNSMEISSTSIALKENTTITGTLTVGADDTGHDVIFYGATSGKKMQWDESADTLVVDGTLDINGNADISGVLNMSNNNSDITFTCGTIQSDGTNFGFEGNAGKEVFISSARDVRIIIDDNNDDTTTDFNIYKHSVASGNELLTINQSGNATFAGDILLADNKKLKLGDNPDLQIYHNGSHSFIQDIGAGDLRLLGSSIKLQNTSETNILTLASDLSATFAGSLTIPDYINHAGDSGTKFGFDGDDTFTVRTGGAVRLTVTDTDVTTAQNFTSSGYVQAFSLLYLRDSVKVLNKATDGWLNLAARDTSGSEAVYNLDNIGTIISGDITAGNLIPSADGTKDLGNSSNRWRNLELKSGGQIQWQNGDARIIEGAVNDYSLSFQTYSTGTSSLSTALRLDGDNTATFAGNVDVGGSGIASSRFTARGSTDDSSAYALEAANSSGASIFYVRNDGLSNFAGDVTINASLDIIRNSNNNQLKLKRNGSATGEFDIYTNTDTLFFKNVATSQIPLGIDGSNNATFAGDILVNTATSGRYIQIDHSDDSLKLADNNKAKFGTGNDLQIYHDGSNSYIKEIGTGTLRLQTNGGGIDLYKDSTEFLARFITDGAVELYYDSAKKLETTSAGVKTSYAATSSTDGDAAGDIVYFSETSTTAGRIYYYTSNGAWELADADAVSSASGMLAVALGSGSATHGMLLRGMVTLNHDPGAVGDTLFLSTAVGQATATAPSGTGDIVRVIGYCLHASNGQIYFNPDGAFVEVTAG